MAPHHDIAVIGGGPAGAIAALCAAREGLKIIVFERSRHPRFRIGESFLPQSLGLLRELDLENRLRSLPHIRKVGASLMSPDDEAPTDFLFSDGLTRGADEAFNIARAPFDAMLLDACRDAGAEVRQACGVREFRRLSDDGCEIRTDAGLVLARQVIDASGQASLIARRAGLRRPVADLDNVACFGHFKGVHRRTGELGGMPLFVMMKEGWAWFIPIDADVTSVGLVMRSEDARRTGVGTAMLLDWATGRCDLLHRLLVRAAPLRPLQAAADFSYRCEPYCGPGFFLAGDAATFLDPVFSTGVCMAMMSGRWAAESAMSVLRDDLSPSAARRDYARRVERVSRLYLRFIRRFYTGPFRDLFMQRTGPFEVHRALMTVLAGNVFPKPAWGVAWRLRLFTLFLRIHEKRPIAPVRRTWSLFEQQACEEHSSSSAPRRAVV